MKKLAKKVWMIAFFRYICRSMQQSGNKFWWRLNDISGQALRLYA
jgi:hypothetical protein